jgi:hypothetical protein
MIQRMLKPNRRFEFWKSDSEFHRFGTKVPRSGCLLDVSKLQNAGVEMRPLAEAFEDSLHNWQFTTSPVELAMH